jgi:hypothetical protein
MHRQSRHGGNGEEPILKQVLNAYWHNRGCFPKIHDIFPEMEIAVSRSAETGKEVFTVNQEIVAEIRQQPARHPGVMLRKIRAQAQVSEMGELWTAIREKGGGFSQEITRDIEPEFVEVEQDMDLDDSDGGRHRRAAIFGGIEVEEETEEEIHGFDEPLEDETAGGGGERDEDAYRVLTELLFGESDEESGSENERREEEIGGEEAGRRRERTSLAEWIETIQRTLRQDITIEELEMAIEQWNETEIDETDLKKIEEETPFVALYKEKRMRLPQPGFYCPYCADQRHFPKQGALGPHILMGHPEKAGGQQLFLELTRLLGDGTRREVRDEEEAALLGKNLAICPYRGCSYTGEIGPLSSHAATKHKKWQSLSNRLGMIWGPMIAAIEEGRGLQTIGEWTGERSCLICAETNCGTVSPTARCLMLHSRSAHGWRGVKNEVPRHRRGTLMIVERDNRDAETAMEEEREELETETMQEVREIEELARGGDMESRRGTEVEEGNGERNRKEKERRRRILRKRNRISSRKQREREAIAEKEREKERETEERRGSANREETGRTQREGSNQNKIEKAQKWISKYRTEEERGAGTPTLTANLRKRVAKNLIMKFNTEWIPLIEAFSPESGEEEERIKLDGAVYKVTRMMRKHVQKAVEEERAEGNGRSEAEMGSRGRGGNRVSKQGKAGMARLRRQAAMRAAKRKRTEVEQTLRVLQKFTETSERVKEMIGRGENDTHLQNEMNELELKMKEITNRQGREWTRTVFGGESIEDVRHFAEEEPKHREEKFEWIRSTLEQMQGPRETKNEIRRLRDEYENHPKRTLEHKVWPRMTPNTTLTAEAFATHYGRTWSSRGREYSTPGRDSIWTVPERLTEESRTRLIDGILDEEEIQKVVASRNIGSAHGRDGISYGLFKLAPEPATRFLKQLFRGILKASMIPTSWKTSRTIFIYKKGDPDQPSNWRPIGITSTIHRLFTCTVARAITAIATNSRLFDESQKGFVFGGPGCLEHSVMAEEILHDAQRRNTEAHLMALDFTNAFGSVPHQLFLDVMRMRGLPDSLIAVIADLYHDNSTVVEMNGQKSEHVSWKRGVIQGCPLSPILFDICLEPLLQTIRNVNGGDGIEIRTKHGHREVEVGETEEASRPAVIITHQAYADDVILFGNSAAGLQRILQTVAQFCSSTGLELNPKKCSSLSRLKSSDRSPLPEFTLGGDVIPSLRSNEAIQYLGNPIAGRREIRAKSAATRIERFKTRLKLLFASALSSAQKIHALKTFLIPSLEYALIVGAISTKTLEALDQNIRGTISRELNLSGIPQPFYYIATEKGGLGLISLEERQRLLQIAGLVSLIASSDRTVADSMTTFITDEAIFRNINPSPTSRFFNWATEAEDQPKRNSGTSSIVYRAKKAATRFGLSLEWRHGRAAMHEIETSREREIIVEDGKGIIKWLTKIRRRRWLEASKELAFHMHSFNLDTSAKFTRELFNSPRRKFTNDLLRFTVGARTNGFKTPEINAKRNPETDPRCPVCLEQGKTINASLAHILNGCRSRSSEYTWRHNLLEGSLTAAIQEHFKDVTISHSRTLNHFVPNLPPELASLKPDLSFLIPQTNTVHLVEISVPYPTTAEQGREETRESLKRVRNTKIRKYEPLRAFIEATLETPVMLSTIIVSSTGTTEAETEKDLKNILVDKKERNRLMKKLEYDALIGSAAILRRCPVRWLGDSRSSPFDEHERVGGESGAANASTDEAPTNI